jgi:hypothetical protein
MRVINGKIGVYLAGVIQISRSAKEVNFYIIFRSLSLPSTLEPATKPSSAWANPVELVPTDPISSIQQITFASEQALMAWHV